MIQRSKILNMISQPDEKLLYAKVLDQADFTLQKHERMFTDFIDMAKAGKLLEITNAIPSLLAESFGGRDGCERLILGFAPDYMEITHDDFPITALWVKKNKKFGQTDLGHGDYLGSLLGLGIDRGKTGDILVIKEGAIIYVKNDMVPFIMANLKKVSRTPVEVFEGVSDEILKEVTSSVKSRRLTVPSLRLDAVAGAAFNISRGRVQDLIRAEKASVNWSITSSTSFQLKQGDMISIRGYGRFSILEAGGLTKKGRIGIEVGIY